MSMKLIHATGRDLDLLALHTEHRADVFSVRARHFHVLLICEALIMATTSCR